MPAGISGVDCLHCVSQATGKRYFRVVGVGQMSLYCTSAATAPWPPSHAGAGMRHIKSLPRQCSLEGAYHTQCGNCITWTGVPQVVCVGGSIPESHGTARPTGSYLHGVHMILLMYTLWFGVSSDIRGGLTSNKIRDLHSKSTAPNNEGKRPPTAACSLNPPPVQEHARVLIYLRVLIFCVFLFLRPWDLWEATG